MTAQLQQQDLKASVGAIPVQAVLFDGHLTVIFSQTPGAGHVRR